MQVPGPINVIEVPETVHTPVVADVKATVKPDVAVADSVGGVSEIILSARAPNVIVCPDKTVNEYVAEALEVAPATRYVSAAAAEVGEPEKRPVLVLKLIPFLGLLKAPTPTTVAVYEVSSGFVFVNS
jgi:quinolinate synthase